MRTLRLFANGEHCWLDEDGDVIEREVVANRERISVPLLLMDHAARDPREVAWSAMCDRLRDGWKRRDDPLPPVVDAMKLPAATSKPAAPLTPPRAQIATTFETCPSCQYLSPSGPVKICQSCGYRASVLPAAPAAAYARYRHV